MFMRNIEKHNLLRTPEIVREKGNIWKYKPEKMKRYYIFSVIWHPKG